MISVSPSTCLTIVGPTQLSPTDKPEETTGSGSCSYGLRNYDKGLGVKPAKLRKAYDEYEPGDKVEGMSMVVVAPKTKGLEPGFIAKKAWKSSDEKKLNTPGHKFYQKAQAFRRQHRGASSAMVRDHVRATEPKFTKRHFVKMLYKEPDESGIVRASKNLGTVKWWLYTETPRDKNRQALMEALGNDIYRALGVHCAKLKLFPSRYTYKSGYPMLVIDGTEIRGPKGARFRTLGTKRASPDGVIEDGCIPGGQIAGAPVVGLGRLKAVFYWLSDFDAVGQWGDNLGYCIDPDSGNALLYHLDGRPLAPETSVWDGGGLYGRTDLMKHIAIDPDVQIVGHPHSTPKDVLMRYFNFSIFDDTTLRERMEGVRLIADPQVRATVSEVFDRYREMFGDGDLDCKEELDKAQRRLFERGDAIAEIFEDRLKLTGEQLDFLDNLEKLATTTRDCSKSGHVELRHLVKEELTEAHWQPTPPTRSGSRGAVITFDATGWRAARTVIVLRRFFRQYVGAQLTPEALRVDPDSGCPTLVLAPHEVQDAMQRTTEDAVRRFKCSGFDLT
jgi:hypothetical protein